MSSARAHPLASPEGVFGSWCTLGSPLCAELLGRLEVAYVCLDLQHGLVGLEAGAAILQAISTTGAMPLVRVPGNEPWLIGRALDLGARGVVVPMVSTPEEAARAAQACRYPPDGSRSWGAVRTSASLGATAKERNAVVLCIAMVETVEGVVHLEEICRTPGIDAIYVGPRDLALAHGLEPGPELDTMIATIASRCRQVGIPAGIHAASGEAARQAIASGFSFATIASDRDLLARAARAELAAALGRDPGLGTAADADLLRAAASYV